MGAVEEPRHPTEDEHRSAEQSYWRWSLVATVLTIVVAAFAAFYAYRAFNEARRQADAAEKANRPWIESNLNIIAKYSEKALYLTGVFELRNIGHTPAVFVFPGFQPYFSTTPEKAASFIDRICDAEVGANLPFGNTIFPDQILPFRVEFNIDFVHRDAFFERAIEYEKDAKLYIGACICYRDAISDMEKNQTRSLYYVIDKITGKPVNFIGFIRSGNIDFDPANFILLPEISSAKSLEAN